MNLKNKKANTENQKMAASIHNFILTYEELNIITVALNKYRDAQKDENGARRIGELLTKIREQRDSGYPAKDYPFWRNYFEDTTETNKENYENTIS